MWSLLITLVLSFVPGYLTWKHKRREFWTPLLALPVVWYIAVTDTVQWLVVAWWLGKPALIWEGYVIYAASSTRWFDCAASGAWLFYGGVTINSALEPDPPPDEPDDTLSNQGD